MTTPRSRLTIVLTLVGAGLLVAFVGAVAWQAINRTSPLSPVGELADIAPAVVTTLVLAGLAAIALRRRDRALLGLAAGLAVLTVPMTLGLGLLVGLLWLPALVRLEPLAGPRWAGPPGTVLLLVGLLTVGATLAPLSHHDPRCWSWTENADGDRTYVEAEPEPQHTTGWGPPRLGGTGTTSQGVEVDPATGEPINGAVASGKECRSNVTTLPQAALALALGAAALVLADRGGRRVR